MQHTDIDRQPQLQAMHEAMRQAAQLWVSGLITDREISDHFTRISADFKLLEQRGHLQGLLDPATGLKY